MVKKRICFIYLLILYLFINVISIKNLIASECTTQIEDTTNQSEDGYNYSKLVFPVPMALCDSNPTKYKKIAMQRNFNNQNNSPHLNIFKPDSNKLFRNLVKNIYKSSSYSKHRNEENCKEFKKKVEKIFKIATNNTVEQPNICSALKLGEYELISFYEEAYLKFLKKYEPKTSQDNLFPGYSHLYDLTAQESISCNKTNKKIKRPLGTYKKLVPIKEIIRFRKWKTIPYNKDFILECLEANCPGANECGDLESKLKELERKSLSDVNQLSPNVCTGDLKTSELDFDDLAENSCDSNAVKSCLKSLDGSIFRSSKENFDSKIHIELNICSPILDKESIKAMLLQKAIETKQDISNETLDRFLKVAKISYHPKQNQSSPISKYPELLTIEFNELPKLSAKEQDTIAYLIENFPSLQIKLPELQEVKTVILNSTDPEHKIGNGKVDTCADIVSNTIFVSKPSKNCQREITVENLKACYGSGVTPDHSIATSTHRAFNYQYKFKQIEKLQKDGKVCITASILDQSSYETLLTQSLKRTPSSKTELDNDSLFTMNQLDEKLADSRIKLSRIIATKTGSCKKSLSELLKGSQNFSKLKDTPIVSGVDQVDRVAKPKTPKEKESIEYSKESIVSTSKALTTLHEQCKIKLPIMKYFPPGSVEDFKRDIASNKQCSNLRNKIPEDILKAFKKELVSNLEIRKKILDRQIEKLNAVSADQLVKIEQYNKDCFEFEAKRNVVEDLKKCKENGSCEFYKTMYRAFSEYLNEQDNYNLKHGFIDRNTGEINSNIKVAFAQCEKVASEKRISCMQEKLSPEDILKFALNIGIDPSSLFKESYTTTGAIVRPIILENGEVAIVGRQENGQIISLAKTDPITSKPICPDGQTILEDKPKRCMTSIPPTFSTYSDRYVCSTNLSSSFFTPSDSEKASAHFFDESKKLLKQKKINIKELIESNARIKELESHAITFCKTLIHSKDFSNSTERDYLNQIRESSKHQHIKPDYNNFEIKGNSLSELELTFKLKDDCKGVAKGLPRNITFKCDQLGISKSPGKSIEDILKMFKKLKTLVEDTSRNYKSFLKKESSFSDTLNIITTSSLDAIYCLFSQDYPIDTEKDSRENYCNSRRSMSSMVSSELKRKLQEQRDALQKYKENLLEIQQILTMYPILSAGVNTQTGRIDITEDEIRQIYGQSDGLINKYKTGSSLLQKRGAPRKKPKTTHTSLNLLHQVNKVFPELTNNFCKESDYNNFHTNTETPVAKEFLTQNPELRGVQQCLRDISIKEERERKEEETSVENSINKACMAAGVATMSPTTYAHPGVGIAVGIADGLCSIHMLLNAIEKDSQAQARKSKLLSCIAYGDNTCDPEDIIEIIESAEQLRSERNWESVYAALFFVGAVHDVKNLTHAMKVKSAQKTLIKAIAEGPEEALTSSRKVFSDLFGFEFNDDMLKSFSEITKGNRNRYGIFRWLAFEKIEPGLKKEVFELLVNNPQIIDALKSGWIRGQFRPKRSLLRNLFENEDALKQFNKVLKDPSKKEAFIKMIKSVEGAEDEKTVLKAFNDFFKDTPEIDDLKDLIKYNIDLLKPFGRTKRVAGWVGRKAMVIPSALANGLTSAISLLKGSPKQIRAISRIADDVESQISELKHLSRDSSSKIQAKIDEIRKSKTLKKAEELLGEIQEELRSQEELKEKLIQKVNALLKSKNFSNTDQARGKYVKFREARDKAIRENDIIALNKLYNDLDSHKKMRDQLMRLGVLEDNPCY